MSFPTFLIVDGRKYEIVTSYRAVIEWSKFIDSPLFDAIDKFNGTLQLFFLEYPHDPPRAYEALQQYLLCGKAPEPTDSGQKDYDFEQDYNEIWSAFKDQYGIDLNYDRAMHWWEFKALFDELSDDTKIKQIIQVRVMPYPDPAKEPEHYARVADAKIRCALKERW